jgi:DNA helicase-2/ATP-dependent DNA helicase PcrA
MIACGHCGERHATVADVRECTGDRPGDESLFATQSDPEERPALRERPMAEPIILTADWDRLAGPPALGRSVVVLPGQSAPAPWAKAERIAVSGSDNRIPDRLIEASQKREALVIELSGDLPPADPVLQTDFWTLGPDTDLEGELLRHLVLGHAVDARDPEAPSVRAVDLAVAAGATVATDAPGDVDTPNGPMWCDGGQLHWLDTELLGASVIPAANLAVGNLTPLGSRQSSGHLAPDQEAAVAHAGGAARIIAPAGSGKTRVLTERARHLISDRGIATEGVCLLAFNVRAREEMQERTRDLAGLQIRTLNSLALAIMSGTAPFASPSGRGRPRVIDERGVRSVLDQLVSRRRQAMSDPMAVWIEALGACRLGLRSPAAVEQEFGGDVKDFANVLPQYRDVLARQNSVDFDEQILGAIEILLTDVTARNAARRSCQVLLVDEFQDLTPAHVLLIRLLAGPAAHVFAVGDDDQTIYGYSGASPAWLIDFDDLFWSATSHDLEVNYRCPSPVVDAAVSLLSHNRTRIVKNTRTAVVDDADDESVFVHHQADPVAVTCSRVADLLAEGVSPRDIAVLTRVNSTLLGPMLTLEESGVGTTAIIDDAFTQRTGVAGALAWLRLATAPERALPGHEMLSAARRPPRGLSARVIEWMSERSSPRELIRLAEYLREERDQVKVTDFVADLMRLRQLVDDDATTEQVLLFVRDELGLGVALEKRLDASRRSVDRSAHSDDLAALLAVARHQLDPKAFPDWLSQRLQERRAEPGGVRLSTIHKVKGREWPHVIIHEAGADLFPHRLAADLEEERRIFHVAVTRCSKTLTIVAGTPPSPFIAELTAPFDPTSAPPTPPAPPVRDRATATATPLSADDAGLRESLRAYRWAQASAAAVPAYVIFNDATLDDLVARRPTDDAELLRVKGIGPVKIEKHGVAILEIINGT